MKSEWCRAEWECAREGGIGLIVVVDVDKFPARALIKSYVEAGYGWLFENQGTYALIFVFFRSNVAFTPHIHHSDQLQLFASKSLLQDDCASYSSCGR